VSPYQLYHQQVPFGICADSLRQLRRDSDVNTFIPIPLRSFHLHCTIGLVMNHTHSAYSILQDKKITTACALSHTRRPMSSSSASPSLHLPVSRTCEKSGSLRSTITALAYRASLSALRQICVTTRRCARSLASRRCSLCGKKMASAWPRTLALSSMWSARLSRNSS
jgi:hypothetical protein